MHSDPRSAPSRQGLRRGAGLAALLLLAGCGGQGAAQDLPAAPRLTAIAPQETTPEGAAPRNGGDARRGAGPEPTPEGVRASLDRATPSDDNWISEYYYELAKAALAEFVDEVGSSVRVRNLDRFVSPSFRGTTSWAPTETEEVFRDGALRYRVGTSFADKRFGSDELPLVIGGLLKPFGWAPGEREDAGIELYTRSKIYTTDRDPARAGRFDTMANLVVAGPTSDGAELQIYLEWLIGWELQGDSRGRHQHARIRSMQLETYYDVRNEGPPLFADVSERVFAGVPRFRSEFLVGAAEYHHRLDLMDGNLFSGQIGVSVGDVDEDGLDDIFVPQQGGHPNRLLRHLPDDTVQDISEGSGLELLEETQSALILDFDNDGHADVAMASDNLLVIGYGDGTGKFELMRPFAAGTDKIKSMAAADWDGDGDLDIYCCMYSKLGPLGTTPRPYHDANNGPANVAWRNDLDADQPKERWKDVTAELGLDDQNNKFSYSAIFEDFDRDGDLDLYVVNDFGRNNFYRNDEGRFSDVAVEVGADDVAAGMGVSAGDVDLDGDVDLYVTNMWSSAGRRIASQRGTFMGGRDEDLRDEYLRHARGNTLLLNRGDGTFEDATERSGAMNGGWAWGAMLVDLNNDGLQDVYSPNGFITGKQQDDL